jgi:predicted dehydrogenase
MGSMVQIAIVGCAHIHTPGFIKTLLKRPDIRVKHVWDPDPARAEKRAAELGSPATANLDAVLGDRDVQATVVCSQTCLHEELVSRITQAGKHLFVEKPLGMGARDALSIAGMIERAGVIFQTGYANRGVPAIQFIREHVKLGTFGKITRARYSVCHHGALDGWFDSEWRWMADRRQAGVGAFGDLGTHGLDILIWLLGEVDRVAATFDHGTARYPDCEETGEAIIVFKNGTIATLAAAWDDLSNPVPLLVSGTEAHASIFNDQLFFKAAKVDGADGQTPYPRDKLPHHWPHAFDLFLDAIGGKDVPLVGVREAAYRSVVMDGIYRSNQGGQWVRV